MDLAEFREKEPLDSRLIWIWDRDRDGDGGRCQDSEMDGCLPSECG